MFRHLMFLDFCVHICPRVHVAGKICMLIWYFNGQFYTLMFRIVNGQLSKPKLLYFVGNSSYS
jgi:hypothetical protein